MTYCVGLLLNDGMVMLSDTRTNAGLDNIATYRKMFVFEEPGDRVIAIMTAGSLSVTQTPSPSSTRRVTRPEATPATSIMLAPSMLRVAELIGQDARRVSCDISAKMDRLSESVGASMIVGGQRKGGDMRMFLIYPQGNFIEATEDTPFLHFFFIFGRGT